MRKTEKITLFFLIVIVFLVSYILAFAQAAPENTPEVSLPKEQASQQGESLPEEQNKPAEQPVQEVQLPPAEQPVQEAQLPPAEQPVQVEEVKQEEKPPQEEQVKPLGAVIQEAQPQAVETVSAEPVVKQEEIKQEQKAISDENYKGAAADNYQKNNFRDSCYKEGISYFKRAKYEEALTKFQEALEWDADYQPALKYIRLTEYKIAQREKAKVEKIPAPYGIAKGDILDITVWQHPELSKELPVRSDGIISYPFLGDIQAHGLTVAEFKEKITQGLSKFVHNSEENLEISVILKKRGRGK